MRAALLAFGLTLAALPVAAETPTEAYLRAEKSAKAHEERYSGFLDASVEGPALLQAKYRTFEVWAADWLDRHQDAPLADLITAAANLGPDLKPVRLDSHSLLISVSWGEEGTVFILSNRSGHHAVAWDIAAYGADPSISEGRNLAAWSPERAKDNCREQTPDDKWGTCGPLYAYVGPLPAMATGLRRFYVEAGYGTIAGATIGQQFSIWTWDGKTAKPILVHHYARMVEQPGALVQGNRIHIPAKGAFKQLFACGSCVGRELRIVIDLTSPKGAELVAEHSLTPELDAVDELYDRVQKGEPAQSLATPNVIRKVRSELKGESDDLTLGMIMTWKPVADAGRKTICLNTDNEAGPHLFTFAGRGKQRKIVDMQPTRSQCDGPGARN